MMWGVTGKILRVELNNRRTSVEEPGESFYRTYGGGSALACYHLLRERPARVDPLSPENLLVFASGPVVGTGIPGANRYSVAAVSPLTGCYGEAEAGGWWSPELKRAGYDAVLVEGASENPVYLWIQDGKAELRDHWQELERRWHRLEGRLARAREGARADGQNVREATRLLARELRESYEHLRKRL